MSRNLSKLFFSSFYQIKDAFLFKRLLQQQIVLKTDGWAKIDVENFQQSFSPKRKKFSTIYSGFSSFAIPHLK